MSVLKIEGATDGLSDREISFIREILQKHGYNNKITFETSDYSNVLRIKVEDFKIIAKIAPKTLNSAFHHEIVKYEEVLRKLVNLQIAGNIPRNDLLKHASCIGGLEPQMSLYEDLTEIELAEIDAFSNLSNDAVLLILKTFYMLNNLASTLQKNDYELFDSFKSKLFEMCNETGEFNTSDVHEDSTATVEDNYKKVLKTKISQRTCLGEKSNETERHCRELFDKKGDFRNNLIEKRNWVVLERLLESLQLHIRGMRDEYSTKLSHFYHDLNVFDKLPSRILDALTVELDGLKKFMVSALKHLQIQIDLLIETFDEYEMRRRKTMLLIHGLKTASVETVLKLAHKMGVSLNSKDIKVITTEKYNTILVEFARADRQKIWSSRRFADDGVVIQEYLTKRRQEIYNEAHKRISGVSTKDGVVMLTVYNTDYTLTSIQELDKVMDLINARKVKNKNKQGGPKKLPNELATLAGGSGSWLDSQDLGS